MPFRQEQRLSLRWARFGLLDLPLFCFGLLGFVLLGLWFAPTAHAQDHLQSVEPGEATLHISVAGEPIGTEHYKIHRVGNAWQAQADIRLHWGGNTIHQTATLTLSAHGEPTSYQWRMEEPHNSFVRVQFVEGRAIVHYPLETGAEDRQEFDFQTNRLAILDNNVFHHFALLAFFYDFEKGGTQELPVFVPQSVQPSPHPVQMEFTGIESIELQGKKISARHLRISTTDNQLELWLSEKGELLRFTAPATQVVVEKVIEKVVVEETTDNGVVGE